MKKMNMKTAAEFIFNTYKENELIIAIMDGPTNSSFFKQEESISWDTAKSMYERLTDPEVCGDNEDLFYFTIGVIQLLEGEARTNTSKLVHKSFK